ncbi:MAG: RebB family R body protein [Algicola sp.]|nr:RebB family R body protein [Algicola sp.]
MPVNEQITDSVTQVNTKVVGETPAMAMGNLLMATSQALGNSAHNATAAQQQAQITMQAATVQGVNSLMAIGSSVIGRSAEGILEEG